MKKRVPAPGSAEDLVSQLGVAENDPRAMRIAKITGFGLRRNSWSLSRGKSLSSGSHTAVSTTIFRCNENLSDTRRTAESGIDTPDKGVVWNTGDVPEWGCPCGHIERS